MKRAVDEYLRQGFSAIKFGWGVVRPRPGAAMCRWSGRPGRPAGETST